MSGAARQSGGQAVDRRQRPGGCGVEGMAGRAGSRRPGAGLRGDVGPAPRRHRRTPANNQPRACRLPWDRTRPGWRPTGTPSSMSSGVQSAPEPRGPGVGGPPFRWVPLPPLPSRTGGGLSCLVEGRRAGWSSSSSPRTWRTWASGRRRRPATGRRVRRLRGSRGAPRPCACRAQRWPVGGSQVPEPLRIDRPAPIGTGDDIAGIVLDITHRHGPLDPRLPAGDGEQHHLPSADAATELAAGHPVERHRHRVAHLPHRVRHRAHHTSRTTSGGWRRVRSAADQRQRTARARPSTR